MSATGEVSDSKRGSLAVIGTGIRLGQLTLEAQQQVTAADVVFALVSSLAALEMLRYYNEKLIDLGSCYAIGKERLETYGEMVDLALAAVRSGQRVCFAIYGHPGVFAYPGRSAIERARSEGYDVKFLPGISAEDSMFCDLEIDPAVHGCQIYSATTFVRDHRAFDPEAVLTLWQVSIIGESRLMDEGNPDYHRLLCDRLESVYGQSHPIILYEAASTRFFEPYMGKIAVSDLRKTKVRPACTLVIPPLNHPDLVRVPLVAEEPVWISLVPETGKLAESC